MPKDSKSRSSNNPPFICIPLYDWYAGQALGGLCADPSWQGDPEETAVRAQQVATLMLRLREDAGGGDS